MKAVILAAGKGTRMFPLTNSRPKVMLPIVNKPLLEHILEAVKEAGITQFLIITRYCNKTIENYFGDGKNWDISIEYIHQPSFGGTADAIKLVEKQVNGKFIVINGDMVIDSDHINKLIKSRGDAVISVKRVEEPSQFGIVTVDNEHVKSIVEKPEYSESKLANAGIYLFDNRVFKYISMTPYSSRDELEITSTLSLMINSGLDIGHIEIEGTWIDVGRPWDLLSANEVMMSHLDGRCEGIIEPYATLNGDISIGKGTIIRNGAYIVGPVKIGRNCDIGPNCYIRPGSAIGNDVNIGNAVEIKNSIIMNKTNIGHLSYVGDSIIGTNCNFGAGTKVANLRHDGNSVRVFIKDKLIDSGRRKLGVIMGDNVHTGINTSINTGTIINSDQCTMPGEVIKYSKDTNSNK